MRYEDCKLAQQATMLAVKVLSAFVCQTPAGLSDMDVISKMSVKSCHITNSSHGLLHARVLIAFVSCAAPYIANLLFEHSLDSADIVSSHQRPVCDSTCLKRLTPWSLQLLLQYGL